MKLEDLVVDDIFNGDPRRFHQSAVANQMFLRLRKSHDMLSYMHNCMVNAFYSHLTHVESNMRIILSDLENYRSRVDTLDQQVFPFFSVVKPTNEMN